MGFTGWRKPTVSERTKPMRRQGAKARKADVLAAKFKETIPVCEVCRRKPATDCHEIWRGGLRLKCRGKRYGCLGVCRECHDDLDDTKKWTKARQLAILRRSRREDFDLETVMREFYKPGSRAVTLEEIDAWTE